MEENENPASFWLYLLLAVMVFISWTGPFHSGISPMNLVAWQAVLGILVAVLLCCAARSLELDGRDIWSAVRVIAVVVVCAQFIDGFFQLPLGLCVQWLVMGIISLIATLFVVAGLLMAASDPGPFVSGGCGCSDTDISTDTETC